MKDTIDIIKFTKDLPLRSRGQACVIFTHEYSVQKEWAAELSKQTGFKHLDLFEYFESKSELAENLSSYNLSQLFKDLSTYNEHDLIIISGTEFLTSTWAGQQSVFDQFATKIENWNKKPALMFVMQYEKSLLNRKFTRHPQYKFVIDIKDTYKLT